MRIKYFSFLLAIFLGASLFGCTTSAPQTQAFQGESGSTLKVTPMSLTSASGEVTFIVEPSFPADSINFVIAGGSLDYPVNMPEEMPGSSWQKKLDTKKYPNGTYRLTVFLGNEAGEEDTIRVNPFIISN